MTLEDRFESLRKFGSAQVHSNVLTLLLITISAFCGLYGLRPTFQRVPNMGCKTYVPGRDSIMGTYGPLAHSLEDVELFMSVLLSESASPWRADTNLLEMPWGVGRSGEWEGEGKRKLRIGIMKDDGENNVMISIRNALDNSEAQLRASEDVEVVEFKAWKMQEGWEILRKLVSL